MEQYEELLAITNLKERGKYFRYTMMTLFKEMWDLIIVPIKAKQESGYDVLIATKIWVMQMFLMINKFNKDLSILKDINAFVVADNHQNLYRKR